MKVGDNVKFSGGEGQITAIHDSGRLEITLADGRATVLWPDAVQPADEAAPAGKAVVTHNGKTV